MGKTRDLFKKIRDTKGNFLEKISSLSHSVVFLYFFVLITEEGFLISLLFFGTLFKRIYLSFSPLPFTSLLSSAICKASSDNHFAFLLLGLYLTLSQISPNYVYIYSHPLEPSPHPHPTPPGCHRALGVMEQKPSRIHQTQGSPGFRVGLLGRLCAHPKWGLCAASVLRWPTQPWPGSTKPQHLLNQERKPEPRLMLEGVKGESATVLTTKNTHPQLIRPAWKLKIGDARGRRRQL